MAEDNNKIKGAISDLGRRFGSATKKIKGSVDWFRKKLKDMSTPNRGALMRNKDLQAKGEKAGIGKMGMFFYDPKHKETLPYYDQFPLVIFVKPVKGGFHGLNLHYLPPDLRAIFLAELIRVSGMDKATLNSSSKIAVTYEMLTKTAKLRYFKPCYKHYLTSHMKSQFKVIHPEEWAKVAFLPTANFKKASKTEVWKDSKGML